MSKSQKVVVTLKNDCVISISLTDKYPFEQPESIYINDIELELLPTDITEWSPALGLKHIVKKIQNKCESTVPLDYENLIKKYPNVLPEFNPSYCRLFEQFIEDV